MIDLGTVGAEAGLLGDEPQEIVDRRYEAFGAAAEFFRATELELLCESGAGTGKTYSLLQKANWTARQHPGSRQLFARQTRKSLNESVLVDWEEKVLWPGHPAIHGSASKEHRDTYVYPNGSVISLVGLENVDRILSAQYDRIYVFQAEEVALETWEKLISRLRWGRTPYHQIVADVNPASEFHWLNQRALAGKMRRVCYRHEDNPLWYDHDRKDWTTAGIAYVQQVLGALTGARRERLLFHRWVSEEGVIWNSWDPAVHRVTEEQLPKEFKWKFGSFDKGTRKPGCFQVWGVDGENRAWRVAEIYRTGEVLDWWAEQVCELQKKWNMVAIACDPSEPEYIDHFNDRLGHLGGRAVSRIARKADNSVLTGIDLVDWALREKRMFFLRDALVGGRDKNLAALLKPCCTEEEILSYVWVKAESGKPIRERPDPACEDHGCLVAGTEVLMADGSLRPIESIQAGEGVLTPLGPSRVIASGMTDPAAIVWDLDGLVGTADHPVATLDRGWIRLDSLRYGDRLAAWENTAASRRASGAGSAGIDTQTPPIGDRSTSLEWMAIGGFDYTELSGSASTGQFQTACTFTTSTAIGQTTLQRTLHWSLPRSTQQNTRSLANAATGCSPTSNEPVLPLHDGTRARKDALGTVRTLAICSADVSGRFARSAARLTRQLSRLSLASAIRTVRRAPFVVGVDSVYNLTVEAGCYYAGGVLVSNCDATRYAGMFLWGKDYANRQEAPTYNPGTFGQVLGHADVLSARRGFIPPYLRRGARVTRSKA